MRRMLVGLAVAGLLLAVAGPAAAADARVSELHALGTIDPAIALSLAGRRLSPQGKLAHDESRRALIVLDHPERQAAVRDALERLQGGAPLIRVEARFVDRETSLDAGRGETGQLLLPPPPSSSSPFRRWAGSRVAVSAPARQELYLFDGGTGELFVGREVPFVGWLLGDGKRRQALEPDLQWREVETGLEVVAVAHAGGGLVRVALAPALAFLEGRLQRRVVLGDLRTIVDVPGGGEVRLRPARAQEEFFARFLSGYDPLRQVRRVDLVLRASVTDPSGTTAGR